MKTLFATFFAAICCMVAQGEDFAQWVDPFVGTVGDGNCFPGPCRPFGMVQPSPEIGVGDSPSETAFFWRVAERGMVFIAVGADMGRTE
jgi:putative alpha-1,2-mannosidase